MATLNVHVHEARGLPIMDRASGLADPYVVVKYSTMEHTSSIARRTRCPHWDEQFRFDLADVVLLQEDPVEVRVYDHDIISRDDLVGFVMIDCNAMMMLKYEQDSDDEEESRGGAEDDARAHEGRTNLFSVRNGERNDNKNTSATTGPMWSGWFPLYDTLSGLRGEIRLTVRIKFHAADNPLAPCVPRRYVRRLKLLHSAASSVSAGAGSDGSFSSVMASERHSDGFSASRSCEVASDGPSGPIVVMMEAQGDAPIPTQRAQHPSLADDEEGILIFSADRLDPSAFRIESVKTMVEELLVKADPENSRLTNLRSTRATQEARLLQLFKLSGKVRRQLARKVVELRCNAVLGYWEAFDIEANGIIVRAYGTPTVVTRVKCLRSVPTISLHGFTGVGASSSAELVSGDRVESRTQDGSLAGAPRSLRRGNVATIPSQSMQDTSVADVRQTSAFPSQLTPPVSSKHLLSSLAGLQDAGTFALPPSVENAPGGGGDGSGANTVPASPQQLPQTVLSSQPMTTRSPILLLTVKDMPAGSVQHIGGHVCSRSVKLVGKAKSRQMMSQERDAWWMELREELRANARAFHCNAILGYEEETQYCEDVVLLTLSGTAVMLDTAFVQLRSGPEVLFRQSCARTHQQHNCQIMHLYQPSSKRQHHSKRATPALQDLMPGTHICRLCERKLVPEVLLSSCAIPPDAALQGQPRLVHAMLTKSKRLVRGEEMAIAISQVLPFMEFTLHKQLLFQLRLNQMNACFCLKVRIEVGDDIILGTLTGTAVQLAGLPIPTLPRVEIMDPGIAGRETVQKLKDVLIRRQKRLARRQRRQRSIESDGSSEGGGGGVDDVTNCGGSDGAATAHPPQPSYTTAIKCGSAAVPRSQKLNDTRSPTASSASTALSTSQATSSPSNLTTPDSDTGRHDCSWVTSTSSTDSSDRGLEEPLPNEDYYRGTAASAAKGNAAARAKVSDFVVKIDDEDEAAAILGQGDESRFEDKILLTVPYIPHSAQLYGHPLCVVSSRCFTLSTGVSSFGTPYTPYGGAADDTAAAGLSSAGAGSAVSPGSGTRVFNTRTINECCADAKRAFVEQACRVARNVAKDADLSPEHVRVFDFQVRSSLIPRTRELWLELSGCLMYSSAAQRHALEKMVDRSFKECIRSQLVHDFLLQQQQQHQQQLPSHTSTPPSPSLASMLFSAAEGTAVKQSPTSPEHEGAASSFQPGCAESAQDLLSFSLLPETLLARMASCSSLCVGDRAEKADSVDAGAKWATSSSSQRVQQFLLKHLFVISTAPFSLPFVFKYDGVPPLMQWDGSAGWSDSSAVCDSARRLSLGGDMTGSGVAVNSTSREAEEPKGVQQRYVMAQSEAASGASRHWKALLSKASSSVKSLAQKASAAGSDFFGSSASNVGGSAHASSPAPPLTSQSAGAVLASAANDRALSDGMHLPCAYLPRTWALPPGAGHEKSRTSSVAAALAERVPDIHLTSSDFAAGYATVRFVGRLSQHFVRYANSVASSAELGKFYQQVQWEVTCYVSALVRLMGGNAVLKYTITHHEVLNDLESSGNAFVLLTVTGDVVQLSQKTMQ